MHHQREIIKSFKITINIYFSSIWVFPEKLVPLIIHFNRVFHDKPSILGYPNFWKHPYRFASKFDPPQLGSHPNPGEHFLLLRWGAIFCVACAMAWGKAPDFGCGCLPGVLPNLGPWNLDPSLKKQCFGMFYENQVYILPGTLNNHFSMDVWWNNHFLCNDLESSSWNNHKKVVVWSSRLVSETSII